MQMQSATTAADFNIATHHNNNSLTSSASTPSLHPYGVAGNNVTFSSNRHSSTFVSPSPSHQPQRGLSDDSAVFLTRESSRSWDRQPKRATAAWYGSEYLSSSGSMLSKKEGSLETNISRSEGNRRVISHSGHNSNSDRSSAAEREKATDFDNDLNGEIIPIPIIAPVFPYMGRDTDIDELLDSLPESVAVNGRGVIAASTAATGGIGFGFGGWSSSSANRHDEPLLRFLPDDKRIEQLQSAHTQQRAAAAAASNSNNYNTNPVNANASRKPQPDDNNDVVAPGDTDLDDIRPSFPSRVSSAHADPRYSPSLLQVTDLFWASCATSKLLQQAQTSDGTNMLETPPILPHDAYVTIRMLMCMCLLQPSMFESRLTELAKMVELDFLEECGDDSASGLTLPMFHSSLCQLASAWSSANSVEQFRELLSNLYLNLTEEVEPDEEENNFATITHSQPQSPVGAGGKFHSRNDTADLNSPLSPLSPNSARGNNPEPSMSTAPPQSRPRRFKSLPSSVLAAVRLASEEVALEREREREAAAHRKPRRKKRDMDRERKELKDAMASKSSEMIQSKTRKEKASVPIQDDQQPPPAKKKRSKDADNEEELRSAREKKSQKKKKIKQPKQVEDVHRNSESMLLMAAASSDGDQSSESDDSQSDVEAIRSSTVLTGDDDSTRSQSRTSQHDSPRTTHQQTQQTRANQSQLSTSSPRTSAQQQPQQQQTSSVSSPRKYMSAAEIRRSARDALESPPVQQHSVSASSRTRESTQRYASYPRVGGRDPIHSVSRWHRSNGGIGDGDGEEDDGTSEVSMGASSEADAADRSSEAGSRASSASRVIRTRSNTVGARSQQHQEVDLDHETRPISPRGGIDVSRDSPPGFVSLQPSGAASSISSHPSSSIPSATKQSRLWSLQQQALMHRARISTGRTHSGHVLPAYIVSDDGVAMPHPNQQQNMSGYSYAAQPAAATRHSPAAFQNQPTSNTSAAAAHSSSVVAGASRLLGESALSALLQQPTQPAVLTSGSMQELEYKIKRMAMNASQQSNYHHGGMVGGTMGPTTSSPLLTTVPLTGLPPHVRANMKRASGGMNPISASPTSIGAASPTAAFVAAAMKNSKARDFKSSSWNVPTPPSPNHNNNTGTSPQIPASNHAGFGLVGKKVL